MKLLLIASVAATFAAAACAGNVGGVPDTDANGTGDAGPGCSVAIDLPLNPTASATNKIRATARVLNASGAFTHTWTLKHDNAPWPYDEALPNLEAIEFLAPTAGVWVVELGVAAPGIDCFPARVDLTVVDASAVHVNMRLHVNSPGGVAPTVDALEDISGGGDNSLGIITISQGTLATGQVQAVGIGNIPAYLRLLPSGSPEAVVEGFAGTNGVYDIRVRNENHDVLVIPEPPLAAIAPKLFQAWTPAMTALTLDGGTSVTGTVKDGANAAVAGAKVRATLVTTQGLEVPSTIATTDAAGAFTLRASPVAGATLRFDVTPPASSGLPHLQASSGTFVLGQAVTVKYNALTLRDLANTTLRRGGVAVPGAKVAIVGTLGARGTIQTGTGTPVSAVGDVRITATADGAGKLPSTKAPALPVSAVVEVAPGDLALVAIDLTAAVPATIDAPTRVTATTAIQTQAGTGVNGVLVDFIPIGDMALASAPLVHATSGANGAVSALLASGGHYELRFADPMGRGASMKDGDITGATVKTTYKLGTKLQLSGLLKLAPNATPLEGATVQVLCTTCTGIERSRPIAEMVTDSDGAFSLAVPDPGKK